MFRNPRDRPEIGSRPLTPSTGRPPTPPNMPERVATIPSKTVPMAQTPKRMQGNVQVNGKGKPQSASKAKATGNASILSFFKKAETAPGAESNDLFLTDNAAPKRLSVGSNSPLGSAVPNPTNPRSNESRYNENNGSVKRSRTSFCDSVTLKDSNEQVKTSLGTVSNDCTPLQEVDSNSADVRAEPDSMPGEDDSAGAVRPQKVKPRLFSKSLPKLTGSPESTKLDIPTLKQEETSTGGDGFDGIEDFIDDEFPEEGEEFAERLWLQEQRALERAFEAADDDEVMDEELPASVKDEPRDGSDEQDGENACPICNASLRGQSADQASLHVNRCLDGDPLPVSRPVPQVTTEPGPTIKTEVEPVPLHKRFQRSAIPRPPQESPFTLAGPSKAEKGGSAFSKIMSTHAEDEAWSQAASNEVAARGKPAFQRTCPFYKIMPGFFTCVDAFRYGAVEGCNAYFLSHFHSDHYIGLTSSWCHGPIYCSHVTANLVRQQLRVDPKWVVDLEFEQKQEIPNTQGVHVTMIPANHCPGSSLFLFEKVVGKGSNPKMQRVLHCGDFRACPAHVQHPLLRPDVVDAVSGSRRQQKLDVCYLDTTYLTPKYAFPSQEQVIKACADMCVSLSKEQVDEQDSWEQTKKQRAGTGMVKFVRSESTKREEDEEVESIVSAAKEEGNKRGRLLVICGTYSIGKERICLGIAKALNSKIFAPAGKQRICKALEDPEISSRLTTDPYDAQVHMQMIMEIRAETLADYLTGYKPRFTRIVGFRPSGWNYRPPNSRFLESPSVQTVLHSDNWKTRYSMAELVPQRGSTREASCFGVPYSEHSSFRELSMFCCALRIDKIIPTVNVGSAKSREKMKVWIEKWNMDKKKHGLFQVPEEMQEWS